MAWQLLHAEGLLCALGADPVRDAEEPEVIEEYLDDGHAVCVAFNRRGTLLASEWLWKCRAAVQPADHGMDRGPSCMSVRRRTVWRWRQPHAYT